MMADESNFSYFWYPLLLEKKNILLSTSCCAGSFIYMLAIVMYCIITATHRLAFRKVPSTPSALEGHG